MNRCLALWIVLSVTTSPASAQSIDVLRVKPAGIIKGKIVALFPDSLIKIETPFGDIYEFRWSEIVQRSAESPEEYALRPPQPFYPSAKDSSWQISLNDLSVIKYAALDSLKGDSLYATTDGLSYPIALEAVNEFRLTSGSNPVVGGAIGFGIGAALGTFAGGVKGSPQSLTPQPSFAITGLVGGLIGALFGVFAGSAEEIYSFRNTTSAERRGKVFTAFSKSRQ